MIKEKILEALDELGFVYEKIDPDGYVFEYERVKLLYMANEDDDEFLNIAIPFIYEIEDESMRMNVLEAINETNKKMRYTKTLLFGDNVWIAYEANIYEGMEVEDVVRFACNILVATLSEFYAIINPAPEEK